MRFFKLFFLLLCLFYNGLAIAQLNNSALGRRLPVSSENANQLRFGVYAFGFGKNNEYFNKIADGYTLFGYQLNPTLSYYPASFVRIDAGVFVRKDFGSKAYQQVAPTFTIKVQREHWALLFGTLEGSLSHGYIEPLYDIERVITDRLENGAQYQLQQRNLRLDAWVNWVDMLYTGEQEQEKIHGGATAALTLLQRAGRQHSLDTTRLMLPLQFTAQHRGGQIDASDLPLVTLVNTAVGLELKKAYGGGGKLHSVYTKNYWVGYKDFSNVYQKPFNQGQGIYLNVGADTEYADAMVSYWHGNGYISELGGKLYQSASTTYKNPEYTEKKRQVLILRLMKDVELLQDLYLTLRLEPVLDLNRAKLEFSNSLYLTFNTDFFVAQPRR